ncbi:ribonuclease H-like domain-containing protein [Tanacetum coccineum]
MSKVLQERGSRNLPSSTKINPRHHVKSIWKTVDADTTLIRRIGSSRYDVSVPQNNKLFFKPRQTTIPFPSHLYDDCYNEEEGSYGLKDLDAYSIGTTLYDDSLHTKEKDPKSFTLPCIINNLGFNKALADLGASVSVMPFSTYTKLGLGKLAPTKLIIELADRTVKCPKGIVENVLLEAERARRRDQEFNWETATYGKVKYFKDIDYFKDFENEFPAIVYKDALTSELKVSSEPTVSAHHVKKVDFNFVISFDESDDEDYTFTYDKNSFSYKLVSVNDSKSDSDNDDDKIDIKQSPGDLSIEALPNIISINVITYAQGSNKPFETSHVRSSLNTAYPGFGIRRIDFL